MAPEAKHFGGRWRVVRELGRGGQGIVYEVRDSSGFPPRHEAAAALKTTFRDAINLAHHLDEPTPFIELADTIRNLSAEHFQPTAALKKLLPLDEAVNAETAKARMQAELDAMKAIDHPALVRVLDDNLAQEWFVMEHLGSQTLGSQIGTYRGRVLDALRAFRSVVDAVRQLHSAGFVHRDIKPDNMFIVRDRLVLGDCGLAIRLDKQERLSMALENVGSRDWMPAWAQGMRLDQVRPTFDVFSLGKVLWSMISGKSKLLGWYFDDPDYPQFMLENILPDNAELLRINRILAGTVVEKEKNCLPSASALLEQVDDAIDAMESGSRRPTTKNMRCHVCGLGRYIEVYRQDGFGGPDDHRITFVCDQCGHLESFLWPKQSPPSAWLNNDSDKNKLLPTDTAPVASGLDPRLARQIDLVVEELGRNIPRSGVYAASLATKHLERLIDYAEQHPEDGHFRSVEPDLQMVMDLTRAQTRMSNGELERHQSQSYKPHAEGLKLKLQNLKHMLAQA